MKRTLWLRSETKPFEQRVALTPTQAGDLLIKGHRVIVEESPLRVFKDHEYAEVGCEMVKEHSWITDAPLEATIFGLKELEAQNFPLPHRHIHFAHVFKDQDGSADFLGRLHFAGGKLFDLEYLTDGAGKRVAAFGVWAGFTGAALGLDLWLCQRLGMDMNTRGKLTSFDSSDHLVSEMRARLSDLKEERPKVLIIGAKGRCGRGARDFFNRLGIEATLWGSKDTKARSHIKEILDFDLLVNCALMTTKSKPWLTLDMFDGRQRLTAISDVSCDPTGPCNPLPLYPEATTMDKPAYYNKEKNFAVTSIDHLPSLLPRESSEDFASQLYPHLLNYMEGNLVHGPWERALNRFYKAVYKYHTEPLVPEAPFPRDLDSAPAVLQ
jgi:hypothetical protein